MLVAYTVAIDLVRQLRPIVEQIKMHDAHLADQLKRAATNTVANLAEGDMGTGSDTTCTTCVDKSLGNGEQEREREGPTSRLILPKSHVGPLNRES
jgi:hypothetical protein